MPLGNCILLQIDKLLSIRAKSHFHCLSACDTLKRKPGSRRGWPLQVNHVKPEAKSPVLRFRSVKQSRRAQDSPCFRSMLFLDVHIAEIFFISQVCCSLAPPFLREIDLVILTDRRMCYGLEIAFSILDYFELRGINRHIAFSCSSAQK